MLYVKWNYILDSVIKFFLSTLIIQQDIPKLYRSQEKLSLCRTVTSFSLEFHSLTLLNANSTH